MAKQLTEKQKAAEKRAASKKVDAEKKPKIIWGEEKIIQGEILKK